jgi:membrane protein required for colicin V production
MAQLSITAVDALVIGIVLISAGFAMLRGLIHETFAILEWIAGGYVALRFTPLFQPLLNGAIKPPWLEWLLVFIGTFLVVFIPLSIMSHRLSQMVKQSDIGPVDRVLGFVFGVARGLVIVGLAYIAFTALVPAKDHPASLTQARSFPLIRNTSEILRELAPRGIFASNPNASVDDTISATKTAGASGSGALDTLVETNGGSGTPSQ